MLSSIFTFAGWLGGIFAIAVYRGWIITHFWKWFVVSTFPTLPMISIPAAIGISVFIAGVTHQWLPKDPAQKHKSVEGIILEGFMRNSTFFALGWIVQLFM